MSTHSDQTFLGDMLDHARKAHARVASRTFEQWRNDETVMYATYHFVQIVGEAASRLSETTRASLPELPWRDMVAVRNRLVHGYGTINPERIWEIAGRDLPELITVLEARLEP